MEELWREISPNPWDQLAPSGRFSTIMHGLFDRTSFNVWYGDDEWVIMFPLGRGMNHSSTSKFYFNSKWFDTSNHFLDVFLAVAAIYSEVGHQINVDLASFATLAKLADLDHKRSQKNNRNILQ